MQILKKKKYKIRNTLALLVMLSLASACSDTDDDALTNDGMTTTDGTTTSGNGNNDEDSDVDDGDDDAIQEKINNDGTSTFTLKLTAEQEAPPLDLPDAEATAILNIDKASGVISGSVISVGLTGSIAAGHIHQGYAGNNGPVILTFDIDTQSSSAGDTTTSGSLQLPAGAGLDSDGLAALANGELYINIHTAENPSGEIRGQIIPIGVLLEDSELSNAEVVNATVSSEASGFGFSTVNEESGNFSATVFLTDLDDATSVEIRSGAEGVDGDLIMLMVQDTSDAGVWRTPLASVLTASQIDELKDEALYFNVTSSRAPLGEIRGQL